MIICIVKELWSSLSLLYGGYRALFPRVKATEA
jgi:hypothetical protein